MPPSKKFHLFRKLVKNAKWWSKSNLPLSHSPDRKMFPFKKGFLNNADSYPYRYRLKRGSMPPTLQPDKDEKEEDVMRQRVEDMDRKVFQMISIKTWTVCDSKN